MKELLHHLLKNMELSVGRGENYFTMSRGSFRYRRLIRWRHRLRRTGYEKNDKGFTVTFHDSRDSEDYVIDITVGNGRYDVKLRSHPGRVNRFWISYPSAEDEHFYGCGETYSTLDLKGEKVRIFVAEHQNTRRITRKLVRDTLVGHDPEKDLAFSQYESYYAQPTFVSSRKYYLHADTVTYAEFDFTRTNRVTLLFQEKPVFHMEAGRDFPEVSEKLSALLGHYGKLPEWLYDGVIPAIQGGTETVDRKIQTALDAGVKVNAVWSQDWCGCRRTGFGYQVMWNWEYDEELYPDLPQMIREWKEKGVRFLGYINPFMAIEKDLYRYAHEHGYCVKNKKGEDYLVTITTFPAAMIDFTNPDAYDWYKGLIKENMIGIGMSGWMADFGEYLPVDCVLHAGNPKRMHNQWPAIWARMNREAIEECGVRDEVFFFMRAGYIGSVRDAACMWTGDQHVDWSKDDGLPSVIPASLSLGMCGQTIVHSDAGGYTTVMSMTRSKELLMRWQEMNVFSPLFRMHEGNQPSRNVQFDADGELLAHLAKMSRIHTALKPYLLELEEEAQRGIPMMRPVFYHYDCMYDNYKEYMLGRDLLVAPVRKQGRQDRHVILPDDIWIELNTGREYHGGTVSVQAPMGTIPVFCRKEHTQITEETLQEIIKEMRS
ncbi:MAG: alpha-glucosidase [Solobacterium sp.]|nr:alpha-glucosidase [Solobacterium sp.]